MRSMRVGSFNDAFVILVLVGLLLGCGTSRPPASSGESGEAMLVEQSSTSMPAVDRQSAYLKRATEPDRPREVSGAEYLAEQSGFVAPVELSVAAPPTSGVRDSSRATSHPHGDQVCASGCAASRHPTPPLSRNRFRELVAAFGQEEASSDSVSLDELIFYGPQTLGLLENGQVHLSKGHVARLQRELAIEEMLVELRVVDERGVVRVSLPPTRVPQHIRQEFAMSVADFQPTITSGTIKRVGVKHAWQRL